MSKSKAVPVFYGVRSQDLRIRFERLGKRRAFFARWRPQIKLWECQLSGYGLRCNRFFGPSQFVILFNLRLSSSVSPELGWRWKWIDEAVKWEGVDDNAAPADMFAGTSAARAAFGTAAIRSKGGFSSAESHGTAKYPNKRYPHRGAAPEGVRSVVGNEGQGACA